MRQALAEIDNRPFARAVARGLAVMLVLAAVAAWAAVRYWTDPVTVRRLVLDQLRRQFPGAEVSIDAARLWPGWGIQVTNLTLARKDDATLAPVLQVPIGRIEHDSEQLTHGRLRVRRLKLERPRLTAVRTIDGKWNLDGLLAPPRPDLALPIIVIERGTLVVRIAPPGGGESVWEVGGIRASMLEETHMPAKFEGRGESARLGRVAIGGKWKRDRGHVDAGVELNGMPISMDLLRELARFAPLPTELIRHLAGEARVQLDVHRRPEVGPEWNPDWRVTVARGSMGLRDLPMDLTNVAIDARLFDGRLVVSDARALAADAPVRATMVAKLPADEPAHAIESLTVSAEHLLVTPELFARLPEAAKRFQQRFSPIGRTAIEYRFNKRPSLGWDAQLELKPEDLAARYHKFPYPLRRVRGAVVTDLTNDGPSRHAVNLSAEINGGSRVAIRGTIAGAEPHPAVDLWITGENNGPARNINVDDDLFTALPQRFAPLARSFHFQGQIELLGRIHHAEGSPHGHDQYHIRSQNAAVCYDAFPVPLSNVAADLEIHLGPGMPGDPNRGDYWVLRNATGQHGAGRVTVTAWNVEQPHGHQLTIDIGGERIPLDDSLAKAVAVYRLGPTWELMSPTGLIDFNSRVTLTDKPGSPKEPAVTVKLHGASVKPGFFPYELRDVSAHVFAEPGRVLLGECSARHGATKIKMTGGEIRTGSGLWVDVRDLRAAGLAADADLIRAMPPLLQRAGAVLAPNGSLDVNVKRMVLHDPPAIPGPPGPPVLYWDGEARLSDFRLTAGVDWANAAGTVACRGSVKGSRLEWLAGHMALDAAKILRQPLEQLHAQLSVDPDTPDVLQVRGVTGRAFGGTVTGEARVAFGGGLDYALDLKAFGIKLDDFGKHNNITAKRLEGPASAQIYLTGRGAGVRELSGRADIDVPSGKIYDLPLALELFKAISLRAPDGVAFDEAHAHVKIEGNRLHVERMDLLGGAVSLGGRGELNLDGTDVQLDFDAVWARVAQVLPVAWRDVPSGISRQFLKIKMRGSLDKPTFQAEPLPLLTEPAKRIWDRMALQSNNQ